MGYGTVRWGYRRRGDRVVRVEMGRVGCWGMGDE